MREILKESLKKMVLNYLGFRFSRQREPLSSFKIQIIILKGRLLGIKSNKKGKPECIYDWKEVI